jgi:glycosyltransferase involved in cell wall biosynthesis
VTNIINGTDVLGEPDILKNDSLPVKIAMVSNLMENKGHDILIAALGLLKKRGLKIDTVLIGDEITNGLLKRRDSFKSQIIIKAKENDVLDQLIFYGYSYQIPVALYEIPIVVLPSDSEGVPNCILEAMSLKKIVVASDVGSVSSIIDHGKNGFLHQPRNVEQLSNLLEMIFNAPIEKMNTLREEAYLKWQNCFSLNRMINGFIKAYDEL